MANFDSNVQREIENLGHYVNGLLDAGQTPNQVVGALAAKGLDHEAATNFVNAVLEIRSSPSASAIPPDGAGAMPVADPSQAPQEQPIAHFQSDNGVLVLVGLIAVVLLPAGFFYAWIGISTWLGDTHVPRKESSWHTLLGAGIIAVPAILIAIWFLWDIRQRWSEELLFTQAV